MYHLAEQFAEYLARLCRGDGDVVSSLMDMGVEVLPFVERALVTESDADVRTQLVHVAWQTRSEKALRILEPAINDTDPTVWKEAIDGLVTISTPEAANILRRARDQNPNGRTDGRYSFSQWIDDALQQIDTRGT